MTTTCTLMLGDRLERMKEIPDGSVDMILADLPYGTKACKWDSVIPFAPLWEQYWRVLKPDCVIALFASEPFSTHLRMSQIKHFKYDWIWDKIKPSGFQIAKYQPMRRTENICIFGKGKTKYFPQKTKREKPVHSKVYSASGSNALEGGFSADFSKVYEDKNPVNLLQYSNADNTNRVHPTQKPVALLEYMIRTYTNPGGLVLDNTMGSGSTGVAAIQTGRSFIGIEKEEEYFEIAERRCKEARLAMSEPNTVNETEEVI